MAARPSSLRRAALGTGETWGSRGAVTLGLSFERPCASFSSVLVFLTRGKGRCYTPARVIERRSKIVCTIGPASDSREALERLILAGMDVARLNFSHGSHEEHARRLETLRQAATNCKKPVAALQDLCGPKIRTGSFPRGAYVLPPTGEVALVETKTKGVVAEEDTIPILYEGLAEDVQPGDAILIDDGRVGLRVRRIEAGR